jgi:hypothetical protein
LLVFSFLMTIAFMGQAQQKIRIHVFLVAGETKTRSDTFKTYIKNSNLKIIKFNNNDTIIYLDKQDIDSGNLLFIERDNISIPVIIDTLSADYSLLFNKSVTSNHCLLSWDTNNCMESVGCYNYTEPNGEYKNDHHWINCYRFNNCFPLNWNPCYYDR